MEGEVVRVREDVGGLRSRELGEGVFAVYSLDT